MPVIVIGADTPLGKSIIDALLTRDGEVRAFVSDEATAERLKAQHVKVALGDVSDSGHVGAAAMRCFTVVIMEEAATDSRERSFASGDAAVLRGWMDAVREAGVQRVIWVGANAPAAMAVPEYAAVDPTEAEPDAVAAEVAALDEVASL